MLSLARVGIYAFTFILSCISLCESGTVEVGNVDAARGFHEEHNRFGVGALLSKAREIRSSSGSSEFNDVKQLRGDKIHDSGRVQLLERLSDASESALNQSRTLLMDKERYNSISEELLQVRQRLQEKASTWIETGKSMVASARYRIMHGVQRVFENAKEPYVRQIEKDMLVARVPRRQNRGFLFWEKSKPAVARVVLYNKTLTVEIVEFRGASMDESSSQLDGSAEYQIPVGEHYPDIGNIHVSHRWFSSYNIHIPLISYKKKAKSVAEQRLRLEASWKNVSPSGVTEDLHQFLDAQVFCKFKHRGHGSEASVCACEKIYGEDSEETTACLARVVDRSYRMVAKLGETGLARNMYEQALSCRAQSNAGDGFRFAKHCLVDILHSSIDSSSSVQSRHLRALLSSVSDEVLFDDFGSARRKANDDESTIPPLSVRTVAVILYFVGMVILFFGLADISRHYRRHRTISMQREHFTRLPPSARYIYTPLLSRK